MSYKLCISIEVSNYKKKLIVSKKKRTKKIEVEKNHVEKSLQNIM